jgi:uncharacterized integral membrane protein
VKRFSWILTLPLIVVAAIFAIANREPITLDLWPFEASPRLPLFVILLACLVFGLVVGSLATWLSAAPTRRRARQARQRVAGLEREVARLRQERDRAARAVAPADSGQPGQAGLPAPVAQANGGPAPKKRSALGRKH